MDKKTKGKVNLIVRIVLGSLFFIGGFTYSNTSYFQEYPLFGVSFLAEFLLGIIGGLFGYYLLPRYFLMAKNWVEDLVTRTIYNTLADVWTQYSKRMEKNRSDREKARKKKTKRDLKERLKDGVLVDTSVLIDGRILNIAKTGFITSKLLIPKFVINELHLLADNKDAITRKKGRRGLDMINELKKHTKVQIFGHKSIQSEVDKELVNVARDAKVKLMTLDFNLNKVAKVENIEVLNINELGEALKPEFVPGDTFSVKIVSEGKEKKQGVGYLSDGTMVVVSDAIDKIDEELNVVVSKLIQTNAGKMVFCEIEEVPVEEVSVKA